MCNLIKFMFFFKGHAPNLEGATNVAYRLLVMSEPVYIRIHYSGAMKKVCVRFQISARSVRRMISMSAGWTGPASVSGRSARRTRFASEVNRLLVYFFWYPRQATIIIARWHVSVFLNGARIRNMSVSMENLISRHTWTVFVGQIWDTASNFGKIKNIRYIRS